MHEKWVGERLSRRAAFRAVWRDRGWGSNADAAQAEKRFTMRLSKYRVGAHAPPEAWQQPGSCLAEALGLTEARGRGAGNSSAPAHRRTRT